MTEQNEFQGLSDFLRLEAARLTDPVCMEAAKCLRQWAKAVDSVQAARATPADHSVPVAIYQVADDDMSGRWYDVREQDWPMFAEKDRRIVYARPPQNAADHIVDANKKVSAPSVAVDRLDKPAQVGNGRFGVGVKWSTVIGAAQRHHDYMNTPEKERDRIAMGKEFFERFGSHQAWQSDAQSVRDADPIRALIAAHTDLLEQNPYAYFELAYTRYTGWMAWLCSNSRDDDPNRKIIAKGQGDSPEAACADALKSAPRQKPVSDEGKS